MYKMYNINILQAGTKENKIGYSSQLMSMNN